MIRMAVLAMAVLLGVAASGAAAADDVLVDDFSKEVAGRWRVVSGEWKVRDGVMAHTARPFPHHDCIVADFPFTQGVIEVKAVPRKNNKYRFASVGIVIKRIDEKRAIWFRFGSYGLVNIDGRGGFRRVNLGRAWTELNREYRLSVIVRNGLICVCVDGIMVGVIRDPLAGKAGRPGLFTESGAEFDDFRVTRLSR